MPTSTITNTATAPDGSIVPNVPVTITLYGQATNAPPSPVAGFRVSDGSEVIQTTNISSNLVGVWSVGLERNSNITPANTFYVAQENFPVANGGPKVWVFTVGTLNQTLQAALTTIPPSLVLSTFLTQAAGDARYVLAPGTFSGSVATSTPGDAGTAGSAASYSHGDHQHQRIDAYGLVASVTTSKPADSPAAGVSSALARIDHAHGRENPQLASVLTAQTTASTTYVDLTTVGPTVTLTTGTFAVVWVGCNMSNNTVGGTGLMSVAVSGATVIAASDNNALAFNSQVAGQGVQAGNFFLLALTAGSNTFTAKYRATAGTETFSIRNLLVWPTT